MIIKEKLTDSYEKISSKKSIWLKCDYCHKEFLMNKRSRELSNKNIKKDSCGDKNCKKSKRCEINTFLKTDENYQNLMREKKKRLSAFFSSEEFKNKRKAKLIEKYGTTSLYFNDDILSKYKNTCNELYGKDNYSKTQEFKDKIKDTNDNKSLDQKKEILKKRIHTSQTKFGKDHYIQTNEYWKERKETTQKKHGVDHTHQLPEVIDKCKNTCNLKYGKDNYSKTLEFQQRYIKTCLDKYGVPNPLLLQKNQVYGKQQLELKNFINSFGFNFETNNSVLCPKEIDLYDENLKLGFEYCGLYWHNELSPSPRTSSYHFEKYKKCKEQNIRLITVFEDEWKQKTHQCESRIKSILMVQQHKIAARSCKLVELTKKSFKDFCEKNHLQGSNNLGLIFYGLEFKEELVGGISLGRHHRNTEFLTLDRLCFKTNNFIVGGANKLFKPCLQWANKKSYKKIISWSDNRWGEGNVYPKLGFKLTAELQPDYSYVNVKNPTHRISKQSQKKSNTKCPIDKTEHEWALQNGLARIWDCGKKQWTLEIT